MSPVMAEMLSHTLLVELILFLIGTPFGSASEALSDDEGSSLVPPQFPSSLVAPGDGSEYVDYVIPLVRRNDFFLKAAKSVPRIGRRLIVAINDSLAPIYAENWCPHRQTS